MSAHAVTSPREADPVYITNDAAKRLGVSPSSLNKWRLTGDGPRYLKLGRRVVYRQSDLDAFLNSRACHSTAEYA